MLVGQEETSNMAEQHVTRFYTYWLFKYLLLNEFLYSFEYTYSVCLDTIYSH
jgi:hypothetical protein